MLERIPSEKEGECMKENKEEGLTGNEKLEEYIGMLQREPSEELLAVTLTAVRRRAKEGGQVIVPVEAAFGNELPLQALTLENGEQWLQAFTSFEEELKGNRPVVSTFLTDLGKLLDLAEASEQVCGLILNPWNRTLMLDKSLLRLIRAQNT